VKLCSPTSVSLPAGATTRATATAAPTCCATSPSTSPPGNAAIVGPTGAGKSTVIKLLLRFYDVDRRRVSLDGRDLRDLSFGALRGAIGLVSQDVFLFHGSVRENIAYGTFDAPLDDIVAAARTAEAHDFIMDCPTATTPSSASAARSSPAASASASPSPAPC
jgi:ABC-type transport system involved in Fe-S cluster assembly fused permease/ATPase subunit